MDERPDNCYVCEYSDAQCKDCERDGTDETDCKSAGWYCEHPWVSWGGPRPLGIRDEFNPLSGRHPDCPFDAFKETETHFFNGALKLMRIFYGDWRAIKNG